MSKWQIEEFSNEQAHKMLLNAEIINLQYNVLEMFKNSKRISFDIEMVKKVLTMNKRFYKKEDIDYICENAIRYLLKNGRIKLAGLNNSREQQYVVVKQKREPYRDEEYGEH